MSKFEKWLNDEYHPSEFNDLGIGDLHEAYDAGIDAAIKEAKNYLCGANETDSAADRANDDVVNEIVDDLNKLKGE